MEDDDDRGQTRVADDGELLEIARAAKNGAKFSALYDGDNSAYASQSEADSALCAYLGFWTNCDVEQSDRLFRGSGLMRKKWDERHGAETYGERTIRTAFEHAVTDTYEPADWLGAKGPRLEVLPDDEEEDEEHEAPRTVGAFPLELLPAAAADYGRVLIEGGLPREYVGPTLLGALSTAVGGLKMLVIGGKGLWQPYHPVLWVLLIGAPSTGKTPTMAAIRQPFDAASIGYAASYRDELAMYSLLTPKQKAERGEPTQNRVTISSFTIEAFMKVLYDNPAGVGIFNDEVAAIINGLGQFKKNGGNDRQAFLSMWSGAPIQNIRVGPGSFDVAHPVVNIVGGVQYDRINDVLRGDDGLRERFLPSRYLGKGIPPGDIRDEAQRHAEAWGCLVNGTLTRRNRPNERTLRPAERERHKRLLWRKYELGQQALSKRPDSASWVGKMDSHVMNIALTLAEVEDPGGRYVDGDDMERAEIIFDYFHAQARELPLGNTNLMADRFITHGQDEAVDKLAAWLEMKDDGRATGREIVRAHIGGLRTTEEARVLMVRYGQTHPGRTVQEPTGERGGAQKHLVVYAPSRRT